MAPPSKLTSEYHTNVVRLIEEGQYPGVAAVISGSSRSSHKYWMELGRQDEENDVESPERRYYRDVTQALARAEAADVNILRAATVGRVDKTESCPKCGTDVTVTVEFPSDKGRAALERLARKFPDRWGVRRMGTISVEHSINREELTQLVQQLALETQRAIADPRVPPHVAELLQELVGNAWQHLIQTRYGELPGLGDGGQREQRQRILPAQQIAIVDPPPEPAPKRPAARPRRKRSKRRR